MKFVHCIPTVGNEELLQQAYGSVRGAGFQLFIIDNSPDGLKGEYDGCVIRPSVPLDYHQTMNFIYRIGKDRNATHVGYQHDDVVVPRESLQAFMAKLEELHKSGEKFLVLEMAGSLFWAIPVESCKTVGLWDTSFPDRIYHSDCDWCYRGKLAGLNPIDMKLPITHLNGGSNTIRDPQTRTVHGITFPMNVAYYQAKWGGQPGYEVYTTPFNA